MISKSLKLICFLILGSIHLYAQGSWEQVDAHAGLFGKWIDGITFENRMIAINSKGYILVSDDFGLHTTIDSTYKGKQFYTLDFVNEDFGAISATGINGHMLYTPDGGSNWLESEGCGFAADFLGTTLDFVTEQSGFFCDKLTSSIYTFTGGCSTLTQIVFSQGMTTPQRVQFIDDTVGYCMAFKGYNQLFKTMDGGLSWNPIFSTYNQISTGDFKILENGMMIIVYDNIIIKYDEIANTIDTVLYTPDSLNIHTLGRRAISFSDETNGYVAFGRAIYKTNDGGLHWLRTDYYKKITEESILFIASSDSERAVVGTSNGNMYRTVTGGMLDINESQKNQYISVFPNPSTGEQFIDLTALEGKGGLIEIFDMKGRSLLNKNIPAFASRYGIDMSTYPQGVYLLKITSEGKLYTSKIMKE